MVQFIWDFFLNIITFSMDTYKILCSTQKVIKKLLLNSVIIFKPFLKKTVMNKKTQGHPLG